jgi:hypothetical protein
MGARAIVRFLSVVVDDFDVRGAGLAVGPFEANPPLHVDADAVLALPVALQSFERVRWQRLEVRKTGRSFQDVQALLGLSAEAVEFPDALAFGKLSRPLVAVALNHRAAP